jgi:hypothetical protein
MVNLKSKLSGYECEHLKVLNVGGGGDAVVGLPPQLREIEFGQLDHLDVYAPSLEKAKGVKWSAKTVNFIPEDIRNFDFSDYDLLLMFDVVEHLPKEDAIELLRKVKHAFIFIPLETGELISGDGIPFMCHLSRWTEQEFIDLGFKTEVFENFHGNFDTMWAEK